MDYLVTGGAGFIGSHTVELLLKQGNRVTVIDNFSTGRPQNLEHLQPNPSLRVLEADINDIEKTEPLYRESQAVIHLAALADIVPSIERPVEYHHANVNGTLAVLECSRQAGIKRFVYAASSSCYGIPDIFPTPETAAIRPQYPYAVTKYLGEQYALSWATIYKMPVVSLRFFNVYGPRSRTSGTYGAVFGVFLAQKLHDKPFTVVGDGNQTRDFTFVKDVARAIVAAAESQVSGEIMNVGSGGHYSVNRIIDLLGGTKIHIPKRPGEPDCTFADTTKIRQALDWKPQTSLEEGISILLDNIDYWRQAPVWTETSIQAATKSWFKYLGSES